MDLVNIVWRTFRTATLAGLGSCSYFVTADEVNNRDLDGDGVPLQRDCDDSDPSIGEHRYFRDRDDDGYGDLATGGGCTERDGFVPRAPDAENDDDAYDCLDTDAGVNPDSVWLLDADGDGFVPDAPQTAEGVCTPPDPANAGTSAAAWFLPPDSVSDALAAPAERDCDDSDPTLFPGRVLYEDADADGFGDPTSSLVACFTPAGYVANFFDCDDADDDDVPDTIWYRDADFDGYGVASDTRTNREAIEDALGQPLEAAEEAAVYAAACAATLPPDGYGAFEAGDCDDDNSEFSLVCPYESVDVGSFHACAVQSNGRAICWGDEEFGKATPPTGTSFLAVETAERHTCGIVGVPGSDDRGEVLCWGDSADDKLAAPSGSDWVEVAVGLDHACARDSSGTISCWGGSDADVLAAPSGSGFSSLVAGGFHTCALDGAREATCWGVDDGGSTFPAARLSPPAGPHADLALGTFHTCALADDGSVACVGGDDAFQLQVPAGEVFTSLDAWTDTTCGLRADGTAVCWGGLDDPSDPDDDSAINTGATSTSGLVSVAAGLSVGCGVQSTGQVTCWGERVVGLDRVPDLKFRTLTAAADYACAATNRDVACWGDQAGLDERVVYAAASITLGASHACGRQPSGRVHCWGDATFGQSTPPADTAFDVLVATGEATCGIRTTDDALACFGEPPTTAFESDSENRDLMHLAANTEGLCGMRADGTVRCWGSTDTLPPDSALTGATFLDVTMPQGAGGTCLLQLDGTVACYNIGLSFGDTGDTGSGAPTASDQGLTGRYVSLVSGDSQLCGLDRLGVATCVALDGAAALMGTPTGALLDLSISTPHACAVLADTSLRCFQEDQSSVPEGERSEVLTPPAGTGFSDVVVAGAAACAIREGGDVVCFGEGEAGQGDPPFVGDQGLTAGLSHLCADFDGALLCSGSDDRGQSSPTALSLGSGTAGAFHTCALRDLDDDTDPLHGTGVCWGYDAQGQATVPSGLTTTRLQSLDAGGLFSCAVDGTGLVTCWGDDEFEVVSAAPTDATFTQVASGEAHACALDNEGEATCWGDDSFGQSDPPDQTFAALSAGGLHTCGLVDDGATFAEGEAPDWPVVCWGFDADDQVSDAPPYRFRSLALGAEHSCGVKADGLLYCWGRNLEGQSAYPGPYDL